MATHMLMERMMEFEIKRYQYLADRLSRKMSLGHYVLYRLNDFDFIDGVSICENPTFNQIGDIIPFGVEIIIRPPVKEENKQIVAREIYLSMGHYTNMTLGDEGFELENGVTVRWKNSDRES